MPKHHRHRPRLQTECSRMHLQKEARQPDYFSHYRYKPFRGLPEHRQSRQTLQSLYLARLPRKLHRDSKPTIVGYDLASEPSIFFRHRHPMTPDAWRPHPTWKHRSGARRTRLHRWQPRWHYLETGSLDFHEPQGQSRFHHDEPTTPRNSLR